MKKANFTWREKILRWQNIIIILGAVFLIVFSAAIGNHENTKFEKSYTVEDFGTFTLSDAKGERELNKFPTAYQMKKGQPYTMTTTLPEEIPEGYGIMLRTSYNAIEVYADGDLIQTYAVKLPLPYGRMTGNIRLIAEIDPQYAGKELKIVQTPYYSALNSITSVSYGAVDALKLDVVLGNIWRLVLASILMTICFVCFGISLAHFASQSGNNNWTFYHLGCLMFYLASWFVCSSDLPQLVTNANEVASLCSFLSLSIIPIHVAAFCAESIPDRKDLFRIMQIVQWCVPLCILIGYGFNLWDPEEVLLFTHISLVATLVISVVKGFRESKYSKIARRVAFANVIFVVFLAGALIGFFIAPTSGIDAEVVGIGIAIYTFYLFYIFLYREVEIIGESRRKDVYKQLAYHDVQTGLRNRGAFNRDNEKIVESENPPKEVDLLMIDLNYLKSTNDKYGHLAGDRLILGAAECIKSAFDGIGVCYRVGGDEFVITVFDHHDQVAACRKKLDQMVEDLNKEDEKIQLSFAIGAANRKFVAEADFMEKVFTEADNAMYDDKRRIHGKESTR